MLKGLPCGASLLLSNVELKRLGKPTPALPKGGSGKRGEENPPRPSQREGVGKEVRTFYDKPPLPLLWKRRGKSLLAE